MISFLHISDLHLADEYHTGDFHFFEKRENIWKGLKKSVHYANEKKIKYIFITGDIYEKTFFNDSHLNRFKRILNDFNGRVIIVSGNHDYFSNSLEAEKLRSKNVFVFYDENKIIFPDDDLTVFGYSWKNETFNESLQLNNLNTKTKYNILLLHSGTKIDPDYCEFDINTVDDRIDYIGLGHIHKPTKINNRTYYAGSLEPLNIKEIGEHGGIFGTIENELKIKFISFQETEYIDIKLDITDLTIDEIVLNLKKYINNRIQVIRITIMGEMSLLSANEIEDALKEYFKIVKVVDKRDVYFENELIGEEFEYISQLISDLDYELRDDVRRTIFRLLGNTK